MSLNPLKVGAGFRVGLHGETIHKIGLNPLKVGAGFRGMRVLSAL